MKLKQKDIVMALQRKAMKKNRLFSINKKDDNQIAEEIKTSSLGFLVSLEWKEIRKKAIDVYGGKCMCCGCVPKKGVNVDHIKPRIYYPELSLEFSNLQILCAKCNKKKGNKHMTDYRNLVRV